MSLEPLSAHSQPSPNASGGVQRTLLRNHHVATLVVWLDRKLREQL
jgi:hypothetical protein